MRYDGPVLLREGVTGIYNQVKQDYVKEDPRIVVGLDTLGFVGRQLVVLVDDGFNLKLDKKLKQIRDAFLEIKYHGRRPPPKGFTKELQDIERLCSAGRQYMKAAYHNQGCDAVFIKPNYAVDLFLFNLVGSGPRDPRKVLKTLLRHELTHRDFAEITPYMKMLDLLLDYCSSLYSLDPEDRPKNNIVTSPGDDFLGIHREELQTDIVRTRESFEGSTKPGEKQVLRTSLEMLEFADKIKNLYIDHLDEALASAVGRLSDTLTEPPENPRVFYLLLRHFETMIDSNGIRLPITKARECAEESWVENRNVAGVL